VTKVAIRRNRHLFANALLPNQVGCGVRLGGEAAVHASRAYAQGSLRTGKLTLGETRVLLKLDFNNAFNAVRRDWMLTQIKAVTPELYPLAYQAYREESNLYIGDHTIRSRQRVQQGDPAGPAFFCLAIKPLTDTLRSELSVWYLDDAIIGGPLSDVLDDITRV
jgi:hypothetical protein